MIHATPLRNLSKIDRLGLVSRRSKCALKTIYLCTPGMVGAAITHAMRRHKIAAEDVAVIEVDVPRSWLRKGRRKGLWHTNGADIPTSRFLSISALATVEVA